MKILEATFGRPYSIHVLLIDLETSSVIEENLPYSEMLEVVASHFASET